MIEFYIPGVTFVEDAKGVVHPKYNRPEDMKHVNADYYREKLAGLTGGDKAATNQDSTYTPKADEMPIR